MIHIATSPDMPDLPRRRARSKPPGVTTVVLEVSEGTLCRFGVSEDQCSLTMAFDSNAPPLWQWPWKGSLRCCDLVRRSTA